MRVNKIWSNDNARWTVKKRSPTCRKRKYISQVKFSGRRHKMYKSGYKLFYERILLFCKQLLSVIESYWPTITTLEIRNVTIRHRISAGASSTLTCFMSLKFWPFAGIPSALWQIYTCLWSGISRAIFLVKT